MKKIILNHTKFLVVIVMIAGLTFLSLGLILSYRDKPDDLSAVTQTDSDVYDPSVSSNNQQSSESEEKKPPVEVEAWGMDIKVPVSSKTEVKSVKVDGDDLYVQTLGYEQLKKVGYVTEDAFDSCMSNLTKISRIPVTATSDDVNANPWYMSKAMHEAYSRRVGDYYLFAKKDENFSACEKNSDILQSVVLPLRTERQIIINSLTLKDL